MPRPIFVNRFFHPDHSATSQILGDLVFHGRRPRNLMLHEAPSMVLPDSASAMNVKIGTQTKRVAAL